jgi:hypothetical protein
MLVVEAYEASSPFKLVKEVPLYKNEEYEPFIKRDNSLDFLKETSFATNGQALMVHTSKSVSFFDLKTGVRVQKMKASEGGANSQDCAIAYDFENNLFYSFKT